MLVIPERVVTLLILSYRAGKSSRIQFIALHSHRFMMLFHAHISYLQSTKYQRKG